MQTIIFFGDSITDSFRNQNAAIGTEAQLGMGYVRHLHARLLSENWDRKVQFINQGISGNTTRQLLERIEEDVLAIDADQVFMMIGINDVWQRFEPTRKNEWIFPEDFQEYYQSLIEKILGSDKELVLLSPFYLENDHDDAMRKLLFEYQAIIQDLALEYKLDYIDVQKTMDAYLEKHPYTSISEDKVHVNHVGNALIANTIYDYIKEKECI